jgi:hypothetical protein
MRRWYSRGLASVRSSPQLVVSCCLRHGHGPLGVEGDTALLTSTVRCRTGQTDRHSISQTQSKPFDTTIPYTSRYLATRRQPHLHKKRLTVISFVTHPVLALSVPPLTAAAPPPASPTTQNIHSTPAYHGSPKRLLERNPRPRPRSPQEQAQRPPAVLRQLLPPPSREPARRIPPLPATFQPVGNG